MKEEIWYSNIQDFFEVNNLLNFFPSEDMSFEEKLNSFFRFCIYFSVLIFLLKKNYKVFYIAFFGGVITFILYKLDIHNNKENYLGEEDDYLHSKRNRKCIKPNKMNPFMNVLVTDYVKNPDRPKACDVSKETTKDKMQTYFNDSLYENIDDVFNKNSSYRQFYTTPSTTIPNDQEGFAKWLYFNEEKTCKEGNTAKCYYV